jgi:CRP-like cAMP-binding protein
MHYIEQLEFTKNWEYEKKQQFNSQVKQLNLKKDEIVFDIGDPTTALYIVKQGQLVVEAEVTLEKENRIPLCRDRVEVRTRRARV